MTMSSSDTGPIQDGSNDRRSTANQDRPWQDEETLNRLYHGQGLTTREIASRLQCSNGTVSEWLNKHAIPTRENWKAGVEAARRANRVERVAQRMLPSGYEYWQSRDPDRTNRIVYVHRLLAVAEYGFDAVAGMDVHHENNIPWDNRPDNIDLLSGEEHGGLHSREFWSDSGGER